MNQFADVRMSVLRGLAHAIRRGYGAIRGTVLGRSPRWRFVAGKFYMHIDPEDFADRAFYLGSYEPHLIELIGAIVRRGDVCLDVGAQKGFVTMHLASAIGPDGRLISFEPDPRAMRELRANVDRNEFEQVELYGCALGDAEATCEFALSRQLGWSSRFPNELARAAVTSVISVKTRRLDDVVDEAGILPETDRLSFLKIDAEGSEPLVLEGARNTLARFRPVVHLELNKGSLRAGGFSPELLEEFFDSLDYRLYAVRFRKMGALRRRRLWLAPVTCLEREVGDCEDILAVHSHCSREAASMVARLAG
jgi:FkbM family methyltransferase